MSRVVLVFWLNFDPSAFFLLKKRIDVSFSCVCPVIDNEFRHNIVKVTVDPRGDKKVVCGNPLGYRLLDPQLLWQCYDEIHDQ